jgi:hypothetical protein
MNKARRHFTAQEKLDAIKRHVLEGTPLQPLRPARHRAQPVCGPVLLHFGQPAPYSAPCPLLRAPIGLRCRVTAVHTPASEDHRSKP